MTPLPNRAQRAKKPLSAQRRGGSIAVGLLALLLVGMILLATSMNSNGSVGSLTQSDRKSERNHVVAVASVRSQPTAEFVNRTEVIWQIPESPQAVVFIAHGCNCRATNFWDRSAHCPHCVGLPEDRLIVLNALGRRFAVVVVSSLGRCWSIEKDVGIAKGILQWWIENHELQKLPVTALGASSGGYFVSALAKEVNFSSVALMISAGVFGSMGVPVGYPPTLFVHMPKDLRAKRLIEKNMASLKKKGVSVKEVRCLEFPLTRTLLTERIPGLDEAVSASVFELFQEKGFIDERGYLKNDGRATQWKQALKEKDPSMEKYEWLDHVEEELNLAFAYHEMTSLPIGDILDWFESHM
ncbi:uncharacterized protein LOC121991620 [Zingiber officinale]|uniref:uncharacterized protein LOC121991620 n=1 Tax=Zingiber officinale TaxID=94328 RepID=UPI001C4CFFDF|nr:uncharacterized protein LOC121991620 [Zingiber officinale]